MIDGLCQFKVVLEDRLTQIVDLKIKIDYLCKRYFLTLEPTEKSPKRATHC